MDSFMGPYGIWAVSITLMGMGALLGGIDHGFFEPISRDWKGRMVMQKGLDLVVQNYPLFQLPAQYIFLGSGEARVRID